MAAPVVEFTQKDIVPSRWVKSRTPISKSGKDRRVSGGDVMRMTISAVFAAALTISVSAGDNGRSGWSVRSRGPRCTSGGGRIAVARLTRAEWQVALRAAKHKAENLPRLRVKPRFRGSNSKAASPMCLSP